MLFSSLKMLMFDTAHYRFFVTFRGAIFWHSVQMRRGRIARFGSRLRSRKVTKNHILGVEAVATIHEDTRKKTTASCPFVVSLNDVLVAIYYLLSAIHMRCWVKLNILPELPRKVAAMP